MRHDDWPARQRRLHGAEGHLLEAAVQSRLRDRRPQGPVLRQRRGFEGQACRGAVRDGAAKHRRPPRRHDRRHRALARRGHEGPRRGRADAAFLWAPTAGYLNKTAYDGRFSIVEVDGPRLTWPAAIGYPKASASLRDSIDAVLPEVSKTFPALFAEYGFATVGPVVDRQTGSHREGGRRGRAGGGDRP